MAKQYTQQEALDTILSELSYMKNRLPNGELKSLIEDMKEIKEDVSELKRTLLNPEDGVIVKVNKNTEFRTQKEKKFDIYEERFQTLVELSKWKQDVTRALWVIFSAVVGLVLNSIFKFT